MNLEPLIVFGLCQTSRTSPDPGLSTSAITLYTILAFHLSPLAWFPSPSNDPADKKPNLVVSN